MERERRPRRAVSGRGKVTALASAEIQAGCDTPALDCDFSLSRCCRQERPNGLPLRGVNRRTQNGESPLFGAHLARSSV
jgi:hypothetical protein